MAKLRLTKNEKWQDFIINWFFANYDFEYFNPLRESYYNGYICNQIIFPKAENGRLVSKVKLQDIADSILADDIFSEKIFGPGVTNVDIIESPTDYRIIWNSINSNLYDNLDDERLEGLYRY